MSRCLSQINRVALGLFLSLSAISYGQAHINITLHPDAPQAWEIPADFAGMSFEQETVRSDFRDGKDSHLGWLEGGTTIYNQFLKTLGIKNVRIGANTGEGGRYAYPTNQDGTRVNDFASELGAVLIWQLPVGNVRYDVGKYSSYAKRLISEKLRKGKKFETVFEVGNEPDVNNVPYAMWQSRFDGYFKALTEIVGTNLLMAGPSAAFDLTYASRFASDLSYRGTNQSKIRYITQHWYPNGGRKKFSNAKVAIDAMLSQTNDAKYFSFYKNFGEVEANEGYLTRISESNSMYGGGFPGASDAFAAALWALDYLCFFAQNTRIAGINFHTANGTTAYNAIEPVGRASNYTLKGVGYGILAFSKFSSGNGSRPITLTTLNPDNINFASYSCLQADGSLHLALINKTYGGMTYPSNNVSVTVDTSRAYKHAQLMYLRQADGDISKTDGISLGDSSVNSKGIWKGGYTQNIVLQGSTFTIKVPSTSAALVRIY